MTFNTLEQDCGWEVQYLQLISDILKNGEKRADRTGTGTIAVFGRTIEINLRESFPLVTTKKLAWKPVLSELLWFCEGSGDERRLAQILHGTRDMSKTTIWSQNAEAGYWKDKAQFPGDLGRVYGVQWRQWRTGRNIPTPDKDGHVWHLPETIDQLSQVIDKIKNNPTDRRIILSAWNVGELDQMALPPCHMMAQFFVSMKNGVKELSCQMYQRSVDTMLGLPFNIASYATLVHMLAQVTGCEVGTLRMVLGDTHIYVDHLEAAEIQLQRKPLQPPKLLINKLVDDINDFTMADFEVLNYEHHAPIVMKMSA